MKLVTKTPPTNGIHTKCQSLLAQISANKTCFAIKISNYELLSVFLSTQELLSLFEELNALLILVMSQTPHPIAKDKIIHFDQYIVFLTEKADQSAINHLSYLLYHNIQLHVPDKHPHINIECKISSVDLSAEAKNHEKLIENLFCTLASSKSSNYYLEFEGEAINKVNSNIARLNTFKHSLSNNTFSFAYQPIVDRITGNVPYYECLLRIPNEHGELVSAGPFIIIAEQVGLNNVLDQIVLSMAVNELRYAPLISLAVNISNCGVLDPNFMHVAKLLLHDNSIAKRLIIEITETSLNIEFEKTKVFAETMRSFGCKIALDDFGSGFTSFKQLQNFNIDIIKIDGSFIRDVIYNQRDQQLVSSLIEIAKKLGAKTVAEFVENSEIAKFLLDVGIDYMQGNFFSPALNYRMWDREKV